MFTALLNAALILLYLLRLSKILEKWNVPIVANVPAFARLVLLLNVMTQKRSGQRSMTLIRLSLCKPLRAVRVALGEELGMEPGSVVTGKMVAALRNLGFDKIFDTNFSADLTIMEEGHEFLHRLTNGGVLPMITSCSPGWVNMIELKYPELLPHLSSAKSPQQMFGAIAKTYYAEKAGIDPSKIICVSVMPCTAKKAGKQHAPKECVRLP